MKIICISKYSAPPLYGVGSRLFYLAREFSRNHEVTLISSDSNHLAKYPETSRIINEERIDDLTHIWVKTKKYATSSSFQRLLSWFDFDRKLKRISIDKNGKPDVIIVSSLSLTTAIYGIRMKKKYNCKLVFEVRDIYPLTMTEELGFSKIHPLILFFSYIEKKAYSDADLIVGTMPNLQQHVFHRLRRDKDVFFSPLGIPEIWNTELCEFHDIDHIFPKSKIIVGYAGSMSKSNALFNFTEVIKTIDQKRTDIHFVLVGEGETKERLQKAVEGCSNVTFYPKIEQKYVPYFLSKCDVLYLSTHKSKVWEFGQSMNKLIDYMMAGKPVIASYSGHHSMLNEADSGVFIDVERPHEIVNWIVEYANMSAEERDAIGKGGRRWVLENRNYDRLARQYLNRIQKLMDM